MAEYAGPVQGRPPVTWGLREFHTLPVPREGVCGADQTSQAFNELSLGSSRSLSVGL